MQDDAKACILTAYAPGTAHGVSGLSGSPYEMGQKRLIRSLIHHGFRYDILSFQDWPNTKTKWNQDCGYNIKAAALEVALSQGYERILWLDSSVWAIRQVEPLFDVINDEGYYFWENGFNLAQTMNDDALEYFGITRDEAEKMPDLSSSMIGLHMGHPLATEFAQKWLQTARDGLWATPRNKIRQAGIGSLDPRYECDRQDQSCASFLVNTIADEDGRKMRVTPMHKYSDIANREGKYSDTCIFVMRGL